MRHGLGGLLVILFGSWQLGVCQQSPIEINFFVLSDGHPLVSVTNNYSRPITAFIMTVNPAGAGSDINDEVRSYHDFYINHHHDRKIAQGESYTIPVPYIVGTDVTKLQPRFMAVIFEDGSTWGDDRWIARITSMRNRLFDELATLKGIVDTGIQMGSSREAMLALVENERNVRAAKNQGAEPEISRIDILAIDNLAEGLRSIQPVKGTPRGNAFVPLQTWLAGWRQALASASSPQVGSISPRDNHPTPVSEDHSTLRRRSATLLSVSLTVTASTSPVMMQAACTLTDSSFIVPAVDNPNNCGTAIWELVATASDGARLDEGQTTAFGQCYGNYTDCQGTFHNPTNTGVAGVKLAQHSFLDNNTPAVKFAWSIDNWQAASYQACSCSDPNPDGETETAPTKSVIFSPFWIHDCS